MRKLFSVLMTALFLISLSSCALREKPEDTAKEIRDFYRDAGAVSMTVDITADYGEKVYFFKISADFSENAGAVTIKEPESVAGVTAKLAPDGVSLLFDGAEIYTGELSGHLSPLGSVPEMISAWREGLVTETVREKADGYDCISVTSYISEGVSLRTWFEEETFLPVRAEFIADGNTVLNCSFKNVAVE